MRTIKFIIFLVLFPAIVFSQNEKPVIDENQIVNQEINTIIYTDKEFKHPIVKNPNWNKIKRGIAKKYREVNAEKIIVGAKIKYYKIKNDWAKFAEAYLTNLKRFEKIEYMTDHRQLSWSVNNNLYSIFKNLNNKKVLLQAAVQSKKIIDNPNSVRPGEPIEKYSANNIDTYANLLYKGGKIDEAIFWESKAVAFDDDNIDFKINLEKMKKGIATW